MDSKKGENQEEFPCNVCSKMFKRKSFLKIHHRSHSHDRPYWCKLCKWSFRQPSHLKKHMANSHSNDNNNNEQKQPKDSHLCLKCFRYFSSVWGLVTHNINTHKNLVEPILCIICKQNFVADSEEMLKHCRAEHKSDLEALEEYKDDLLFKNIDGVMFTCSHCDEGFESYYDSLAHLRSAHNVDTSKYIPESGPPLRCLFCEQDYTDAECLVRHITMSHWLDKEKCIACGKVFVDEDKAKMHFRTYRCAIFRKHLKLLEVDVDKLHVKCKKSYNVKCTECGILCQSNFMLKIHMRKHKGERPYECDVCHKRFSQTGNLNKHRKSVHQGVGTVESLSLPCHHCGKIFECISEMEKHERVHTGEKPFSCEHCGRSFSQRANLKVHIKRWHSGNLSNFKKTVDPATYQLKRPLIDPEKNQDSKLFKFRLEGESRADTEHEDTEHEDENVKGNENLVSNGQYSTGGVFSKFKIADPLPQLSEEDINEEAPLLGTDGTEDNRLVCFNLNDLADQYFSTDPHETTVEDNFNASHVDYVQSVITANITPLQRESHLTVDGLSACVDVFSDQTYFDKAASGLNEGTFNVEDLFHDHAINDRFLSECGDAQNNDYTNSGNELLMAPSVCWWQNEYSPPQSSNNVINVSKPLAHTVIKNVSGGEIKDVDPLGV